MSIPELKTYFTYTPIMDPDPQFVVDEIKQKASEYLTFSELEQIQVCYEYAKKCHEWQTRQSWEHYISHVVQATRFVMAIKPDVETIKGCLLHDVIEDCNISWEEIEKQFGPVVRTLCEGVTKVAKIKYRGEERQTETLKKTFFAMSQDLRVIFIKLADRVHNIQTLGFHPSPEKQIRIANETLEIYVPIAERLGLYQFQYLLENGCFHILHPEECNQIISYLDKPLFYKSEEKGVHILTKLLKEDGLEHFIVKWRLKSPYSIYKKLTKKIWEMDLKKVNDLLAFRIITDSVPNCYLIMGIIHNSYTPLVHKIKDYIVVPKPNGYQSIHSIILGMFSFPVEIQIRTTQMDKQAEFGVAAHFAYKSLDYNKKKLQHMKADSKQTQRVAKLQEIVKEYQHDNESFKHEMKVELLDDTIFVYTPKGEIIELKQGATVLDFAFRIHSEVGLRFKNALVNNSIVPIDFRPQTGDIIQINTRKNQYTATQSWMGILTTSSAKNQLNKFIKIKIRDQLLAKSILNLNSKLTASKLPLFKSPQCLIRKEYESKEEELEWKLLEMLDVGGYGSFINHYYKSKRRTKWQIEQIEPWSESISNWLILIDGQYHFEYTLCPECKDDNTLLIAKSWKEWIKIHRIGCKALATVGYEKLISAQYQWNPPPLYSFLLKLQISNEAWNLHKVLQLLSTYDLNIKHISFLEPNKDFSTGDITIELSNPSKINFILRDLSKYNEFVVIKDKRFI